VLSRWPFQARFHLGVSATISSTYSITSIIRWGVGGVVICVGLLSFRYFCAPPPPIGNKIPFVGVTFILAPILHSQTEIGYAREVRNEAGNPGCKRKVCGYMPRSSSPRCFAKVRIKASCCNVIRRYKSGFCTGPGLSSSTWRLAASCSRQGNIFKKLNVLAPHLS
jgi:hypothetical protein